MPIRSNLHECDFWMRILAGASLIVGIISIIIALSIACGNRPQEPRVIFETISDTNVLDLNRHLPDLEIIFRGDDVSEKDQDLKILTVNIANVGGEVIRQSDYDQLSDWGIKFEDSEVIEARLIETSSDYLSSQIIPQKITADSVIFPKIIFDKDAFFIIEILILHSQGVKPDFSAIGKIAGIDKIEKIELRSIDSRFLNEGEMCLFTTCFPVESIYPLVLIMFIFYAIMALFLLLSRLLSNINSRKE